MDLTGLADHAVDRQDLRARYKAALALFEDERNRWLNERREGRHRKTQPTGHEHICSQCGRVCRSYIGLVVHLRPHQRRQLAEQAVIVGPEGPP